MKTFAFDIGSTAKNVRMAATNPDTYGIRGENALPSAQMREPIAENRKVEMLTTAQLDIMNHGRCPDCNHRGFVMGPRRRNTINIECGKLDCLARFNVTTGFYNHQILTGQRIAKRSEDGDENWGYPP